MNREKIVRILETKKPPLCDSDTAELAGKLLVALRAEKAAEKRAKKRRLF